MKRFANEEARQLETNPAVLELKPEERAAVKDIIRQQWQGPHHERLTEHTYALSQCQNLDDVSKLANQTILMAIAKM